MITAIIIAATASITLTALVALYDRIEETCKK